MSVGPAVVFPILTCARIYHNAQGLAVETKHTLTHSYSTERERAREREREKRETSHIEWMYERDREEREMSLDAWTSICRYVKMYVWKYVRRDI